METIDDMQDNVGTHQRPVAINGMQIGVADTRVLDVDEDLIRTRLLYGNLLIIDGTASLLDDLRPLFGRNRTHVDGLELFRKM
jgi:hypothetical protein